MIEERYGRSAAAQDELAATRAGLRDVLLPADDTGAFPRSATMRALTGRGGNNAVSVLALVGIAVLATRPGVAGRLARAAPLINLLRQFGLTPR
jgi:hypothetical protein